MEWLIVPFEVLFIYHCTFFIVRINSLFDDMKFFNVHFNVLKTSMDRQK